MNFEKEFRYSGDKKLALSDRETKAPKDYKDKAAIQDVLRENIENLSELQAKLYAQNRHGVLILFQALDAAGKDGMIRHVMSGINPQGCTVTSFKSPSAEELDHDYLWRIHKNLPNRGEIGIFNRSYYEEVLVAKVHPDILIRQNLPNITDSKIIPRDFWEKRYREILHFEEYLTNNGFTILKFFLHLSKEEQRQRFVKRIIRPEKNWKFSEADIRERSYWKKYHKAYEDAIQETSTDLNPWYIIPSDNKWFSRLAVSEIIDRRLEELPLSYPQVSEETKERLLNILKDLEEEQ